MLKSTVANTVVAWLVVISVTGCTQPDTNDATSPPGLPETPTTRASTTATEPSDGAQNGAPNASPSSPPTAPASTTATEPSDGAQNDASPSNPPTTAPASTTATEESEGGQHGITDAPHDYMNDLEEQLISVLSSIGVEDPGVAEHGFRDAWIAGEWRGRTALVHGSPDPIVLPSDDVVGRVDLGGVPAKVVATAAFGEVVRFECGAVGYDVASLAGDGESGSSDIDSAVELAQLLVPELPC